MRTDKETPCSSSAGVWPWKEPLPLAAREAATDTRPDLGSSTFACTSHGSQPAARQSHDTARGFWMPLALIGSRAEPWTGVHGWATVGQAS